MNDLTIIRRSLMHRLFGTITTIITVGVAVALLLVLVGMRDAGRNAFERGRGNMHLLVSNDTDPLAAVLNGIFLTNAPLQSIPWSKFEEISSGYPLAFAVPIVQGDSFRGFPVVGTLPETRSEDPDPLAQNRFFSNFRPTTDTEWSFAEGGPIFDDLDVVIGAHVADYTGLGAGDRIWLTHGTTGSREGGPGVDQPDEAEHDDQEHGAPAYVHDEFDFEIVGVLDPTGGPFDNAVITTLESVWDVHSLAERGRVVTSIYIRVATREGSEVSVGIQPVKSRLRADPAIVTVASPDDQITKLFRIVSNIDRIFLGIAVVVLVSSGISILLALYNSMEQRRRQIAVLRVLGCSRGRIFSLVLTESAVIGLLGALAGVGLGYLGGFLAAAVLRERLGLFFEPDLPLVWTLEVVLVTIVMASIAGLVPAAMAYRTPVAKNLTPLG